MKLEERVNIKSSELQDKVLIEIENVNKGLSKKNLSQLEYILIELKSMQNTKSIVVSYRRMIVDSWDYTDELGLELIELADWYDKLKK